MSTPFDPNSDAEILTVISDAAGIEVVTVNVPGLPGPVGPAGANGAQGPAGPANTLTIGTVTTLAAGSSVSATITGTSPNQVLNLSIPQGAAGANGTNGAAANMSIGTVTTLAAGASATATITGTAPNYVLNLGIPQGAAGSGAADATTTSKGIVQLAGDLGGTAAAPTVTGGTHHSHTSSQISDAASAATVSVVVKRDAAGRAQVVDPSASADIATKNYVDVTAGDASATNSTLVRRDSTGGGAFNAVTANTYASLKEQASAPAASTGGFGRLYTLTADHNLYFVPNNGTGDQITLKTYVDTADNLRIQIGGDIGGTVTAPTVTGGTHHTHTSSQISDAASAATASKVIIRDANGRASVADPSVSTDIATKNYVDTKSATASATGLIQLAGDLGGTATAPTVTSGTHHTHTVSQISDSTTVGRSVVTAADAATARTAIGAGTGNGNMTGTGITNVVQITSASYTALGTKDSATLYVIVG